MKRFFTLRKCSAALLAAVLCVTLPISSQAQMVPAGQGTAIPRTMDFEPGDDLFIAFGETTMAGEWEDLIRFLPPEPLSRFVRPPVDLDEAPVDMLQEAITTYVINKAMAEEAREEGVEIPETYAPRLEQEKENAAATVWLEEKGIFRDSVPTEEQIEEFYEENKERYMVPEELRFQHMFLSTYKEYTVKDGDTLESIAKDVAGDEDAVDRIISKETKKPRNEPPEGDRGEELGPKPLEAGEVLMVPMTEEENKAVLEKAQKGRNALDEEEDFGEVAKEYADFGGQPVVIRPKADDKPMLPEIRDTFMDLEDGEISDVVKTKHGYQVIKRLRYQAEGFRPLEDVKDSIVNKLRADLQQKKFESIVGELWEENTSVEVDEELLADVFNEERANDVLLQIGDVKYTAGQFARDLGRDMDEEASLEERRAALIKLPMIQRAVFQDDVQRGDLKETEMYKQRAQLIEDRYLAGVYGNQVIQESLSVEPTEEQLQEQFEKMREVLENQPSADALILTIPPDSEAAPDEDQYQDDIAEQVENLKKIFQDVESEEDFRKAAAQLEEKGGQLDEQLITTNSMRGAGRQILAKKPGEIAGPVFGENNLHMVYLLNKSALTEATLDMFRDRVVSAWKNDQRESAAVNLRNSFKEKAGLEILFKQEG